MITTIGSKTLLPHQLVGLEWMLEKELCENKRVGGLLCDEMGLGKTLTLISLCINNPLPRTLLLCPLAVVPQWIAALKEAEQTVLNLTTKGWIKVANGAVNEFYVSNSDKIIGSPSMFFEKWDRVIIDEAHQIRNFNSERYKYIASLRRRSTWCLTATPIVNKITDVSALLHLINPRISAEKTPKKLVLGYMETYAMARSVEQLRPTMDIFPKEAEYKTHDIDFVSNKEKDFYRAVQGALATELMDKIADHDKNMTEIFEILLRLRQLSVHPQIYIDAKRRKLGSLYKRDDWTEDSTKIIELVNIINESPVPHKWVVFCQFHDEMNLLKERLSKEKSISDIWTYNGSMTLEQRSRMIENTYKSSDKNQVLLLQIHCGGTGLNLQHMDRVVFMSPWWTAALMDQAVGRVQRIGQKNKVEVHHLKLKEGESMNIDDIIFAKVEMKRNLCNEVLDSANRDS